MLIVLLRWFLRIWLHNSWTCHHLQSTAGDGQLWTLPWFQGRTPATTCCCRRGTMRWWLGPHGCTKDVTLRVLHAATCPKNLGVVGFTSSELSTFLSGDFASTVKHIPFHVCAVILSTCETIGTAALGELWWQAVNTCGFKESDSGTREDLEYSMSEKLEAGPILIRRHILSYGVCI